MAILRVKSKTAEQHASSSLFTSSLQCRVSAELSTVTPTSKILAVTAKVCVCVCMCMCYREDRKKDLTRGPVCADALLYCSHM